MDFIAKLFEGRKEKALLDYVEQEAKIAEAFSISVSDDLVRQSNLFLSIVLSGAGGALALAVSLKNNNAEQWLYMGTIMVSLYLFMISAYVVIACLWSSEIYPPANEPEHLYQPDYQLISIRKVELKNRNERILFNKKRNEDIARRLNYARAMAVVTPLVFFILSVLMG